MATLHKKSDDDLADERIVRNYVQKIFPPSTEAVFVVVIKGNLIIEEILYSIIEVQGADIEGFRRANLSFPQLLTLSKSMSNSSFDDRCLSAIRILHKLRNDFAHHLEMKNIDRDIKNLADVCNVNFLPRGRSIQPNERARLVWRSLWCLIGQLEEHKKIEEQIIRNS